MAFSKKPKFDKNYNPLNNRTFKDGDNGSDNLANNHFQFLEFFHVPSEYFVAFKAYLTNFTDDYSTNWESEQVYGRMDPIVTYKNTNRKINCAFQIVGSSVQEAEQNMRRFSVLTQMMYPSYESAASDGEQTDDGANLATIKNGPLFKVKFLNWIQNSSVPNSVGAEESGLLGWIGGFSFAPDLDAGTYQVGMDLYPKYYNVSFDFNVIHEHKLGWTESALKNDSKKSAFKSGPDPKFSEFPYGKSTDVGSKKPQPDSLSKEQKQRFQELNAASQKLIGGS